jgi:hypothetical protein
LKLRSMLLPKKAPAMPRLSLGYAFPRLHFPRESHRIPKWFNAARPRRQNGMNSKTAGVLS